jgi:putative DNA methylase
VEPWPDEGSLAPRAIYLSSGDSANTGLPRESVNLVVTDPPFFDNVHYSELADFFYAWQQIHRGKNSQSTRSQAEVQDTDAARFADKLGAVFKECHRILAHNGLLVFSYHHSRDDGWEAVANAVLGAGFCFINAHPVKAEMSVATPKSQAKEPIQLDAILVCRKAPRTTRQPTTLEALDSARRKLKRLRDAGFRLSRNDRRVVYCGQLLPTLVSAADVGAAFARVESELAYVGVEDRDEQDAPQGREKHETMMNLFDG